MAKGVRFIIPVGLEKLVSGCISDSAREMGIGRLNYVSGMPVGLIPVSGTAFTEIKALKQLAEVEVFHVASGGAAGGEGSVSLLIKGERDQVERVKDIYSDLRNDNRLAALEIRAASCVKHKWQPCIEKNIFYRENVKKGI